MMNKFSITIFLFVITFSAFSQTEWKHGRLKVTSDGHYLQYEDGTPFFWLGDTGWELFHRLKKEEIEKYLENLVLPNPKQVSLFFHGLIETFEYSAMVRWARILLSLIHLKDDK